MVVMVAVVEVGAKAGSVCTSKDIEDEHSDNGTDGVGNGSSVTGIESISGAEGLMKIVEFSVEVLSLRVLFRISSSIAIKDGDAKLRFDRAVAYAFSLSVRFR